MSIVKDVRNQICAYLLTCEMQRRSEKQRSVSDEAAKTMMREPYSYERFLIIWNQTKDRLTTVDDWDTRALERVIARKRKELC